MILSYKTMSIPETPSRDMNTAPKNSTTQFDTLSNEISKISADGKLDELNQDILDQSKGYLTLDLTKSPEELDQKYVDFLFLNTAALLRKQIILNSTRPEDKHVPLDNFQDFVTQNISFDTTEEVKLFAMLVTISKNKESNPKLYAMMTKDWKQGIATLTAIHTPKVSEDNITIAQPSTENAPQTKEKNEWLSKLKKFGPGIAGIGGIGLAAWLIYNMTKPNGEQGGWFGNILKGVLAIGGITAAMKGDFDIMKWFGGEKGEPPLDKPDEGGDIEGVETLPLKNAWKNYKMDLEEPAASVRNLLRENSGLSTLLALKLASLKTLQGAFIGTTGLSIHGAMALAQLPLSIAGAHPGVMLALPFIIGGGAMSLQKLGDLEVPKDSANLKIFLQKKYKDYSKEHPEANLPADISDETFTAMSNVMLGKESLHKYLGTIDQQLANLTNTTVEHIGTTDEKLLQDKNRTGLKYLKDDLIKKRTSLSLNPEGVQKLCDQLDTIETQLKQGKSLKENDILALELIAEEYKLDVAFQFAGEYITATIGTGESSSIVNVAINPMLPPKEQIKAVPAYLPNPNAHIASRAIEGLFGTIKDDIRKTIPEFSGSIETLQKMLPEEVKTGRLLIVSVAGSVYFYGTKTLEYFVAPFSVGWNLLKLLTRNETAEHFTSTWAGTVVPGFVIGSSKATIDLIFKKGAFKEGRALSTLCKNIVMRGLVAPYAAAKDLYTLTTKSAYYGDMIRKNKLSELLSDHPKMIITSKLKHRWTSTMGNIRSRDYGFQSIFNHKEIATKYNQLSELYEITSQLAKADFISNKGSLTKALDEKLQSSQASFLREKHGHLDTTTYKAIYKDLLSIIKREESNLGKMKDIARGIKKATPTEKLTLESEMSKFVKVEQSIKSITAPDTIFDKSTITAFEKYSKTPPKGFSSALAEMQKIEKESKYLTGKRLDNAVELFQLYEKSANTHLEIAIHKMGKGNLDATAINSINKHISGRVDQLVAAKASFATNIVQSYKKLPLTQRTKMRAEHINKMIMDDNGRIATKVLSAKGRAKLFGAQFATVLATQVAVETLLDQDHDLAAAIAGIASMDTLQLLVDILPIGGTLSNAMSTITGKKSLSTLGVKFEDDGISRLDSLGWGIVSLGTDILMFVPGPGTALKGSVMMGRLAKLAGEFSAAAKLLKIWPRVESFAAKVGWNNAISSIVTAMQKKLKGISMGTKLAGAGMGAYSIGKIAIAYNSNPVDLELAKAAS